MNEEREQTSHDRGQKTIRMSHGGQQDTGGSFESVENMEEPSGWFKDLHERVTKDIGVAPK